jgi:hypothetical protein
VAGGRRCDPEPDGDADLRRTQVAVDFLNRNTGKSASEPHDPGIGARRPERFLRIVAVGGGVMGFPEGLTATTARGVAIVRRAGVNGARRGPVAVSL